MTMIASSFRQSVPSAGDASSVEPPKPRQANGKKPRASLSLTVLHWRNLARSFKRAEMSLNLPKEKSPPGEDEGPPLLRAAGCDGIPESLARFASAESIAQLCACCSALRERFAAPALWRELLHRRWEGTALGEADCVRREYARRDVCERWGLSPPPVPTVQLSSRAAHADISTKLLALSVNDAATRETFSPVGRGLVDKENHTPNTQFIRAPTLRRIGRALSSPETTSSSQKSSSGTRLKQDLFQLMTGQEKRVSAFPDTPGDLTAWSGKISCASDGSVHGGRTFQIKLYYDLADSGEDPLPLVTFTRPHCFHPNVDEEGTLCPRALSERCSPVDSVQTVLLQIMGLLSRPCFAAPPINAAAAALWFGDRSKLDKHRRRTEWSRPQPPPQTPGIGRTAFSEEAILN